MDVGDENVSNLAVPTADHDSISAVTLPDLSNLVDSSFAVGDCSDPVSTSDLDSTSVGTVPDLSSLVNTSMVSFFFHFFIRTTGLI